MTGYTAGCGRSKGGSSAAGSARLTKKKKKRTKSGRERPPAARADRLAFTFFKRRFPPVPSRLSHPHPTTRHARLPIPPGRGRARPGPSPEAFRGRVMGSEDVRGGARPAFSERACNGSLSPLVARGRPGQAHNPSTHRGAHVETTGGRCRSPLACAMGTLAPSLLAEPPPFWDNRKTMPPNFHAPPSLPHPVP